MDHAHLAHSCLDVDKILSVRSKMIESICGRHFSLGIHLFGSFCSVSTLDNDS